MILSGGVTVEKIYKKYTRSGRILIQTARIKKLGIGKYGFETSLQKGKVSDSYILNANMPFFDTEKEAEIWIENNSEWQ